MKQQDSPGGFASFYRQPATWVVGIAFLLVVFPYFLPILSDEAMVRYGASYATLPLIFLVAGVVLIRRPAGEAREARRFWTYIGIGFGCWISGQGVWLALGEHGIARALFSDFVYVLFYISLLLAVETQPGKSPASDFSRVLNRYSLIGGSLVLGTAFLYFSVIPGLFNEATYESWKPSTLGCFFLDLYIGSRLLARWIHSTNPLWKTRYGWLSIGFLLWVITDGLNVAAYHFEYTPLEIGSPADLLWYVPFAPFLIGILHGRRLQSGEVITPVQAEPPGIQLRSPVSGNPLLVYAFLMPCLHLLLNGAGLLDSSLHSWREGLLLAETLVLAVLVFRVHRLVMRENQNLRAGYEEISNVLADSNQTLAARVAERTLDLEGLNVQLAVDNRERRIVEERLRTSESRSRAVIDSFSDSLYVLDHDGRITEVFPVRDAQEECDYPVASGAMFSEVFSSSDLLQINEAISQVGDKKEVNTLSCKLVAEQERRRFECRFSPLGSDEVLVSVQEVTRRLEREEEAARNQRLESLGVLADGIAHDFNNLLAGILGNAQLALGDMGANHPLRKSLSVIEQSALRTSKLTDNLLAYAGKAHVALRPLDLRHLIMEMEEALKATAPTGCRVNLQLPGDPLWILGDEAQINQILLNLMVNAGEAMGPRGGEILLRLDLVLPDDQSGADRQPGAGGVMEPCVRLRVRDEGCGMDAETRRRIFDPFYSSKAAGRGLGLASVLGSVSHHRGTITVESKPGAGSEFSVVFPHGAGDRARSGYAGGVPRESAVRGTVLVADDEQDVRDLLANYLQKLGFKVELVENGLDAVALFKKHTDRITIVLLDFAMPGLNGVEALLRIRRMNPDIPGVIISGYSESDAMGRLRNQANTRFVHKPFELSDFHFLTEENFGLPIEKAGQG